MKLSQKQKKVFDSAFFYAKIENAQKQKEKASKEAKNGATKRGVRKSLV